MTRIREQLRNQNLEDLLVNAIQQVGKPTYPDAQGVMDLKALNQIVTSWRSVHAPSYGNVQPNSGVLLESIADGSGLEPTNNQVIDVIAISCANAGAGAPIEFELRLGDLPVFGMAIAPSGTVKSSDFGAIFPLTLSKGNALKFVVTSGTSGDFSAKIAYNQRVS